MIRYLIAGFVSGLCVLSGGAFASPMLDGSQELFNVTSSGFPTATAWESQSLTPTRNYLSSVDIKLTPGSTPYNATVEIYGQTTDHGTALTTKLAEATLANISANNATWYTFELNDADISAYTASHGTGRLLLVLKGDGSSTRYVFGAGDKADGSLSPYAGGVWRYTLNSGSSWLSVGGSAYPDGTDMTFRLYTQDTVPEPATITSIMLGLAVMARRRRR